ncbi:CPBP family intramembrane glutamic endopeptidase [Paenibacillus sp. FSL P4-0338]|uniref:CPBP family intramembrane glutamic endopeptidase n=1 Tax=unclassified Paenibacillus TaxID=185978 RepID=UPI0003E28172|nr:CPBP family intramembrane glutamic endopeptidase [Paenibacillus sp. FSL R7-269]ETT33913.1 caax amino protease family protein [Paenibacillus sp. FSL R7-269]
MNRATGTPPPGKKEFNPKDAVLVFLAFALISAAVIFALVIYEVLNLKDLLSFGNPLQLAMYVVLPPISLLLFGIILTLITPASYIDETNKSYQNYSLTAILAFTFAGALFEELLFRGIIQNVLTLYLPNLRVAIVITTVLFVGMHVQYYTKPLMLLNITIPSLVFGWVYGQTDNLLVPILVHFLMNLGITLLFKYNMIQMRGEKNSE